MSLGWRESTLGEIVVPSGTRDPGKSPDQTFRYVDVSGVCNQTFQIVEVTELLGKDAPSRARRSIKSGDVIFATIRPTLKRVAVVPPKLEGEVCSTGYFVFRTKPEVDNRFLFYYLLSDQFIGEMERLQTGASYPAVNESQIKQQRFTYPPLAEQRRIVAILDETFAGIARAVAATEKNLANARELFDTYLNTVFTEKAEEWLECPFGEVAEIKHGFAFQSQFFADEGNYVLLTPGNFYEEGGYRDRGNKQKYYRGEIPDGFVLKKGAFLIAMTAQAAGLLGSSIIVPEDDKFLHNQRLGLVVPHQDVAWCNEFFFHAFNTKRFRKAVHDDASGVKVRHTSPKKMGRIMLAYPKTISEQKRIADRLDNVLWETKRLESLYSRELAALAELKQSILQKAFTGELTAKDFDEGAAA
jgi:type I restriction enzyme S subunit